jgi:hypothetical protein
MHVACRNFLQSVLDDDGCPEKVVILTHHAPLDKGMSSPFSISHHPHIAACIDGCNLENILQHPKVIVAAHGHTHFSKDMVVFGKTRIFSNQLGYILPRNEIALFRPGIVIDCRDHLASVDQVDWQKWREDEEKKIATASRHVFRDTIQAKEPVNNCVLQ